MRDPAIAAVTAAYRARWGVAPLITDASGKRGRRNDGGEESRRLAIAEALRWGEPCVVAGPDECMLWAVPLMTNARCTGGLVVTVPGQRLAGRDRPERIDARAACAHLLTLATEHNCTNAALLEARRDEARREATRAEAIHTAKRLDRASIHDAWVREEPALVAALRQGDAPGARRLLNRILVVLYGTAGQDLRLLKSFIMELVVTMARTAVEAGAPADRAAVGLAHLAELVAIEDDEKLQRWVARCLNDLLDAIAHGRSDGDGPLLAHAMRIIGARCTEPLGRDQVARLCHLSPSHFSRRFQARFGVPFHTALLRARCNRAAERLTATGLGLGAIAQECGFVDQSHFTRVFRRLMGTTPGAWRQGQRGNR